MIDTGYLILHCQLKLRFLCTVDEMLNGKQKYLFSSTNMFICNVIPNSSIRWQCCHSADLGLESLLIIQELSGPSCQFGNALQEPPAGSGTKAQAKASAEVIRYFIYSSFYHHL